MSDRVGAAFGWLPPYLTALESDFSVYHRVDDMYVMPVYQWSRKMSQLPAYGGAFSMALDQNSPPPARQQKAVPAAPVADGEMTEAQVKARFRQILIETYPEQAAGGINEITAEEMERQVNR